MRGVAWDLKRRYATALLAGSSNKDYLLELIKRHNGWNFARELWDFTYALDLPDTNATFSRTSPVNVWGYIGDPSAVNPPQLITVPAGVQAIQGGIWDGSAFSIKASDGSDIHPMLKKETPLGVQLIPIAFQSRADNTVYAKGDDMAVLSQAGNYLWARCVQDGTSDVGVHYLEGDIGSIVVDGTAQFLVEGYATLHKGGILLEGAGTNKITGYSIPNEAIGTSDIYTGSWSSNISGISISGDVAGVITIINDQSFLESKGLDLISPLYKAYEIDNTAGVAVLFVDFNGSAGNTNKHSMSIQARVAIGGILSDIRTDFSDGIVMLDQGSDFYEYKSLNFTPGGVGAELRVRAVAGDKLVVLLPQYEESNFISSSILVSGGSVTRAASTLSDTTAGRYAADNTLIDLVCALSGAGQTGVLLGSYLDADNMTQIILNPTDITFRKEVATVVTDLVFTFTHGTAPFRVLAKQLPDGMSLQVALIGAAEPVAQTNANTTGVQMASTFEILSDGNGANHATGGVLSALLNDKDLSW